MLFEATVEMVRSSLVHPNEVLITSRGTNYELVVVIEEVMLSKEKVLCRILPQHRPGVVGVVREIEQVSIHE